MKIGDHVAVLDEDLSGKITSVHGAEVVFVDKYGFTHRFPKEKLVGRNPSIYEGLKTEHKTEHRKKISKKHSENLQKIDLHFEKLVKNPKDYDTAERLSIQREELLKKLDYCRKNNIKQLEIIHGIGDGTLQKMVYEILEGQTGIDFHNKEILHHQSGTVLVYLR